jgi:hypothetical protein
MLKVSTLLFLTLFLFNSCNQNSKDRSNTTAVLQIANPDRAGFETIQLPEKAEITPEYAEKLGKFTYVWGWPLVNMLNRRAAITQAPEPGRLNDVLPVAPQGKVGMLADYIDPGETFVTCPNQDVVYGLGFFDLDSQPVVFQVPDFGERFWVYAIYDHRTNQIGQIGKPYGTKPGHYLLVGPKWNGEVPEGVVDVIKSPTTLANAIPRVFQDDTKEDKATIQSVIKQIAVYPLSEYDGTMKTMDWKNAPSIPGPKTDDGGETKWVVHEKFFDDNQLGKVLEILPPLPHEKTLYVQVKELLAAAKDDPAIKQVLVDVAKKTEEDLIESFFLWKNNGVSAGNGWNRSYYSADWAGSGAYDYYNRTATGKSNMFDNRPTETQYYYTDSDTKGEQLNGTNNYKVTFTAGEEPPVNGFWSMTLYNKHHFFEPNKLRRFSLGTKNKNLKKSADGSLTLYVGSISPGTDKEMNWLPAPADNFSLYIRAYWGKEGIIKGTWTPPVIEKYY